MQREISLIMDVLKNIEFGKLDLSLPGGQTFKFIGKEKLDLHIRVEVKNLVFFKKILIRHDVGLGEAYMDEDFIVDDLYKLLYLICINQSIFTEFYRHKPIVEKIKDLYFYFKTKNTLKGSQKNIKEHYDVGNDFYKLWLDETMMYSSAIFEDDRKDLYIAQNRKLDRILDKIPEAKSIWEIGAGWGGFMMRAVEAGKSVYGVSLSSEQIKIANKRMQELGKYPENNVEYKDYRQVSGQFDAVVSIEMIEAVGREYWDTYFTHINKNLKPGGKAVVQVILKTPEESFDRYLKTTDFIREYTFPGGTLLSENTVRKCIAKQDMQILDWYSFGADYASTLLIWMERFDAKKQDILELGYSERFIKQWRFYFAYCAAGFDAGTIDVAQVTFQKK